MLEENRRRVEQGQRKESLEELRKEEERYRELEMIQRQKEEAPRTKKLEQEEEHTNQMKNIGAKKMEGDDNLRTVECLRARLVAERAASRAGKEDAEQMGNKVTKAYNYIHKHAYKSKFMAAAVRNKQDIFNILGLSRNL